MQLMNEQKTRITFPLTIIVSRFNEEITERLYQGALSRLKERNFEPELITAISVPGAVEIPLIAEKIAMQKKTSAIIALGAVIRGETDHHIYVSQQVSEGCLHVMQRYQLPVIFGVLTTDNEAQAYARSGGNMGNKGAESVDCACEMVALLQKNCIKKPFSYNL